MQQAGQAVDAAAQQAIQKLNQPTNVTPDNTGGDTGSNLGFNPDDTGVRTGPTYTPPQSLMDSGAGNYVPQQNQQVDSSAQSPAQPLAPTPEPAAPLESLTSLVGEGANSSATAPPQNSVSSSTPPPTEFLDFLSGGGSGAKAPVPNSSPLTSTAAQYGDILAGGGSSASGDAKSSTPVANAIPVANPAGGYGDSLVGGGGTTPVSSDAKSVASGAGTSESPAVKEALALQIGDQTPLKTITESVGGLVLDKAQGAIQDKALEAFGVPSGGLVGVAGGSAFEVATGVFSNTPDPSGPAKIVVGASFAGPGALAVGVIVAPFYPTQGGDLNEVSKVTYLHNLDTPTGQQYLTMLQTLPAPSYSPADRLDPNASGGQSAILTSPSVATSSTPPEHYTLGVQTDSGENRFTLTPGSFPYFGYKYVPYNSSGLVVPTPTPGPTPSDAGDATSDTATTMPSTPQP